MPSAPRPATARKWSGSWYGDTLGFMNNGGVCRAERCVDGVQEHAGSRNKHNNREKARPTFTMEENSGCRCVGA